MNVMRLVCLCGKEFALKKETWGRRGKCSECGRVLYIPTPDASGAITKFRCGECGEEVAVGQDSQVQEVQCRCGQALRTPRLVPAPSTAKAEGERVQAAGEAARSSSRRPARALGTSPSTASAEGAAASETPAAPSSTSPPPAPPASEAPPSGSPNGFPTEPPLPPPEGAISATPPPPPSFLASEASPPAPAGGAQPAPPPPPADDAVSEIPPPAPSVGSLEAIPPPSPAVASRASRRRPVVVVTVCIVLLAAVGVGGYMLLWGPWKPSVECNVLVTPRWMLDSGEHLQAARLILDITNAEDRPIQINPVDFDPFLRGEAVSKRGTTGDAAGDATSVLDTLWSLAEAFDSKDQSETGAAAAKDTYQVQVVCESGNQRAPVSSFQWSAEGNEITLDSFAARGWVVAPGETLTMRVTVAEWRTGGFFRTKPPPIPEAARIRIASIDGGSRLPEILAPRGEEIAWKKPETGATPASQPPASPGMGNPVAFGKAEIDRIRNDPQLSRGLNQSALASAAETRPELWAPLMPDLISHMTDPTGAQRVFAVLCNAKPSIPPDELVRRCTQGPLRDSLDQVVAAILQSQWADAYPAIPQLLDQSPNLQMDGVEPQRLAACLSAAPAVGKRLAAHLLAHGAESQVSWVLQAMSENLLSVEDLNTTSLREGGARIGNDRLLAQLLASSHDGCLDLAEWMFGNLDGLNGAAIDVAKIIPAVMQREPLRNRLIALKWRSDEQGSAWALRQVLGEEPMAQLARFEGERLKQQKFVDAMLGVWPAKLDKPLKLDSFSMRQKLRDYNALREEGLNLAAENNELVAGLAVQLGKPSPAPLAADLQKVKKYVERVGQWRRLGSELAEVTDVVFTQADEGKTELELPETTVQTVQRIRANIAPLNNELWRTADEIDDVVAFIPAYPRFLSASYFPAKVGYTWVYSSSRGDVVSSIVGARNVGATECLVLRRTSIQGDSYFSLSISETGVTMHQQSGDGSEYYDYTPPYEQYRFRTGPSDTWSAVTRLQRRGAKSQTQLKFTYENEGMEQVAAPMPPGQFAAFRIHIQVAEGGQITSDTRVWLAKGIGVVKVEGHVGGNPVNWTLKEFRGGGRQAGVESYQSARPSGPAQLFRGGRGYPERRPAVGAGDGAGAGRRPSGAYGGYGGGYGGYRGAEKEQLEGNDDGAGQDASPPVVPGRGFRGGRGRPRVEPPPGMAPPQPNQPYPSGGRRPRGR